MKHRTVICTVLVAALSCLKPPDSRAVPGTVQLETGDVLQGDVRLPPADKLELVLADSQEEASIPIGDIRNVEVTPLYPPTSEKLSLLKRLWRRLTGPSEEEQTLTVTLRNGEVYRGWLSWRQSAGQVEVRESAYVARKAYLKPKQIDRERHQPIDVTRQYIRSITLSGVETVVSRECEKCGRSFDRSDYKYCPFDGTTLSERSASAQD